MQEELKTTYVKRRKLTTSYLNKFALAWSRPEVEELNSKQVKISGSFEAHNDAEDVIMLDVGLNLSSYLRLYSALMLPLEDLGIWVMTVLMDGMCKVEVEVLSNNEEMSRNQNIPGAVEFRQFVDSNNLIDIHPKGVWFTWTNGRKDDAAVWERLDRALCNSLWLSEFLLTSSLCLPILCSDHSPLIINIHFGQVQNQIKELQGQLQDLQEVMPDIETVSRDLINTEGVIRQHLEDLLDKEEVLWAQKARQLWLVQGDRNTRYFHTVVRKRRISNRIFRIKDSSGQWSQSYEQLALDYYNKVYNYQDEVSVEEISGYLNDINLPKISEEQCSSLNQHVSEDEIERALFQLKSDKALGA
ncbi:reverse transcriptase [Senna tora]|uniref:Reverse transcriptase n=1 Tax=Senna tora TaxID=362788 RepID=A0A834TQC1_9FABA|nr:reverse transcriptase [Senna tora]